MKSLRFQKFWLALGWAWAAAICWLSLARLPDTGAGIPYLDKLLHLGTYGLLGVWFGMLLSRRRVFVAHLALFALMGAGLEMLQGMGGLRQAEWADGLANLAGLGLAGLTWPKTKGWLQVLETKILNW